MKILLIAINSKYIHTNYAIRLLKAFAEKEISMAEIELAEYTINNLQSQILADIYQRQPDCIMFSCYIWNWEYVQSLCKELPKVLPEADLWLGGPEVSFDADQILKNYPEITGVMIGEGEATFTELVKCYEKINQTKNKVLAGFSDHIDFTSISGLCLPTGYTAARPLLDMDAIPFVYNEENIRDFDHKIIYYESSRGCPFSCSYCLSSIDKTVRFRSEEKTAEDLQFFLDHKIPLVKFVDRTFNCRHAHSEFVLQYLLDHDNGVTNFHFEIAADILSEKELTIMEQMRPGLIQLEIGVQSTNLKTLEEIHRVTSLDTIKAITGRIRKFGNIHQHLDLIAGLPFENLDSFIKSFNEVYAMRPDQFQLGFLKVLKGSFMAQKISDYELKYTDIAPYEVLSTKWLSYKDCLKLKKIEEMVELFYNSGQFTYTLPVLETLFASPYKMYEELSSFFEGNGFFINNPARVYRYQLLLDFALKYDPEREDLYKELLTFDMYLRENCKSRPSFARDIKSYYHAIKKLSRKLYEDNYHMPNFPAISKAPGQTNTSAYVSGQINTSGPANATGQIHTPITANAIGQIHTPVTAKERWHVDVFYYPVWESANLLVDSSEISMATKSKKANPNTPFAKFDAPVFAIFDYSKRNPLSHNAAFTIMPPLSPDNLPE